MKEKRKKVWELIKKKNLTTKTYEEFYNTYYSSKSGFDKLYKLMVKKNLDGDKTEKDFYTNLVCDLNWAKSTSYCGKTNTGDSQKLKDNAKYCGWGNDVGGYKLSKYRCYKSTEPSPAKNAKKCGWGNDVYGYRDSGWKCKTADVTPPSTPPSRGGGGSTPYTGYRDCAEGPYAIGCKDSTSSGNISKLQGCIGTRVDGKFGPDTEKKLKEKIGKITIKKEDIEKVCSGTFSAEGTPTSFTPEDQLKYWKKLSDDGQIYESGLPKKLVNAQTYVYVIKRKKDGTKVPMYSTNEINTSSEDAVSKLVKTFDEFDYEVLYPIPPGTKTNKGDVGVLTAGFNQNDKLVVKIITDKNGFWTPAEIEERFEDEPIQTLQESIIKKILKLRLIEQNVKRTIGSSSDPNKTYVPTSTTSVTDDKPQGSSTDGKVQGSSTDGKTPDAPPFDRDAETVKVMGDLKQRALTIIDGWDNYNTTTKFGNPLRGMGRDDMNKEIDNSRDTLNAIETKDFCDDNVQKQLDASKASLAEKKKKYDRVLTSEDIKYINRLEALFTEVKSNCKKVAELEKKSPTSKKVMTSTKVSTTPSKEPVGAEIKPSTEPIKQESEELDPEVMDFIESKGFTFEKPSMDEKDRLSTRTTVGEQLRNFDADGIYVEYYKESTPIWKSSGKEETDIKGTLSRIESEIPEEEKKKSCRKAIRRLYVSAFPPTKARERETRSVIEDDDVLNDLKNAVVKCDQEMNFVQGGGGVGDELKALYRCRSFDKDRSQYGIARYCMKDYKPLKQDNPAMQMESIVRKHISEAIKNKKRTTLVESVLRKIKTRR